jgi:probable F420-dependent oxidoreductase
MTTASDAAAARELLGSVGVFVGIAGVPPRELLLFAREVEDLGFDALWVNEPIGGEPFSVLGALAAQTSRIALGVGIASTYARDAAAARAGARSIAELSGGRLVMGLGVSHPSSAGARGHDYGPPLTTMREYLDAYESAPPGAWTVDEPPLVLAALGPRMLELAATRTAGAYPYLVTAAQVADARRTIDAAASAAGRARPLLVTSLIAMPGTGAAVRDAARTTVGRYLAQPAYFTSMIRAGFPEVDVRSVSDDLVDALVASGDAATLRARITAMLDAGADHVTVLTLSPTGRHADPSTARLVAPGG